MMPPLKPFPSCFVPLFQGESNCKTFHMKMCLICIGFVSRTDLHVKGFGIRLVLNRGKGNSEIAY